MWDDTDNDVYKEKEHSAAVTLYSQSTTSLELTG